MTGTLHALASTGCTVVCRALATHAQVLPLSEVSPAGARASRFVPDTPFASLLASPLLTDEERERLFRQQMELILNYSGARGWHVLIRDHSHSDFMVDRVPSSGSSLVRVMGGALGPRAVLVRHPLDSYLSSRASSFLIDGLSDIDAYSRRLLLFDEAHGGLPMVTYESFCDHPDAVLKHLADVLELPFEPEWRKKLPGVRLSGNSGRAANEVTTRSRRDVPPDVAERAAESLAYAEACRRWGYAPEVSGVVGGDDDGPRAANGDRVGATTDSASVEPLSFGVTS